MYCVNNGLICHRLYILQIFISIIIISVNLKCVSFHNYQHKILWVLERGQWTQLQTVITYRELNTNNAGPRYYVEQPWPPDRPVLWSDSHFVYHHFFSHSNSKLLYGPELSLHIKRIKYSRDGQFIKQTVVIIKRLK